MEHSAPQINREHIRLIAEAAGLPLPEDRLDLLAPQVQALLNGIAALDELDLDEVEPGIVFRAAWDDDVDAP